MWLSNPLDDPIFWTFIRVTGIFLASAFLVILVLERRHLREMHRRDLFKRLFSWLCIVPVYSLAVLGGRLPLLLLVSLMVFQGIKEYSALVGLPRGYRRVLYGMALLAAPAAFYSTLAFYGLPAVLLIAATLQPLLFKNKEQGVRNLAFSVLGWCYVAFLLGHVMLVYLDIPNGAALLLALGWSVALSDVFAFVIGRSLGRRKLSPVLSPNKTWEGVGGNFLGAYIGMGVMYTSLQLGIGGTLVWVFPGIIAIGSLWGDLFESAIKREFEVKDAGQWLPGFGGLLDRIDSYILVIPLAFYALALA